MASSEMFYLVQEVKFRDDSSDMGFNYKVVRTFPKQYMDQDEADRVAKQKAELNPGRSYLVEPVTNILEK